MKIAVWHNLPSGGGKRALFDHVKGLLRRGHAITVFCPESAEKDYLPLTSLGVEERRLPYVCHPLREPSGRLAQAVWASRKIIRQYQCLDEHCRLAAVEMGKGRYDVIFANSSTDFYMHPLGRYIDRPNLIYFGEPYRFLFEARPNHPWEALPDSTKSRITPGYLYRYAENVLALHGKRVQLRNELANARTYDRILVNSMFSRESIIRAYGLDAEVCYLGIDTDRFHAPPTAKGNYVVSVGGLHPQKGPERIIRALGAVNSSIRPELIWIGNFGNVNYVAAMNKLAESVGVKFVFRRLVTDEELMRTLAGALFMIYAPILEPFGYAPLEANACGIPVVGVAEGGIRESILHEANGLLSSSADPKALAAEITRLLRDQPLREKLGETGRFIVKNNWNLESAIDRLEHHLKEVMTHSQRAPSISSPP